MPKYGKYHGRGKKRRFSWLGPLMALLLTGGLAAVFVFIMPGYVTLTENGITIEFPFPSARFRGPSPVPSPQPPESVVEFLPPSPQPSPFIEPSPSPEPTPEPDPEPVRALFVTLKELKDTEGWPGLRERALEDGVNTLALEIKDTKGDMPDDALLSEAVRVLADPSWELTALISACIDNTIPLGPDTAWAVKHISGVNFLDGNGDRWLNLYKPEVRAYIAELALGAYELGFDRVLLDNIGFPHAGGRLDKINYGGETTVPAAAVNTLLSELRDAFPDRPLDARIDGRTVEEGLFETMGQDYDVFERTFDRLYAGEEAVYGIPSRN